MKTQLVLLLIVAATLVFAWAIFNKKRAATSASTEPWPFYARRPLSPPEQVLFHRLVEALPGNIVLAQVQVSRVLGVKKGFKFNEWNNRINRLSYDFVVCARDFTVLATIELDDKSHDAPARAETDRKKERATTAAGLRLIRWHVRALPDLAAIQSVFAEAAQRLAEPASPDKRESSRSSH